MGLEGRQLECMLKSTQKEKMNQNETPQDKTAESGSSPVLEAQETFQILMEISQLLKTGLDAETLSICVQLCEYGVNPEALAKVIKGMKQSLEDMKATDDDKETLHKKHKNEPLD